MAPEQGLEPWTRGFGDRCSTTELHRRKLFITTGLMQVSITPDLRLLPPAAHDAMLWHIERRYNSGVGKGFEPYLNNSPHLPGILAVAGAVPTNIVFWSEWRDLNSRPTGPKPAALPNCATLG